MTQERKFSSACILTGIGCAILVALGIAAIAGISFWGWNKAKDFEDPQAQAEEVREILGIEELPEGYKPVFGVKVPWVMELAILSDREGQLQDGDSDLGKHAFIYFQFLRGKSDDAELRDFFEGRSDDPRVLKKHGVDVDVDVEEILDRGVVDVRGGEALYVATRGGLEGRRDDTDGISAISLIQCPGDKRLRVAIWHTPAPNAEPGPEADPAPEALPFAGTPADAETLQGFLGQFSLCGR